VVANRGGDDDGEEDDEVSSKTLRSREAMFTEQPWLYLPAERVGIFSLRERLAEVLGEITDRAFPQLRSETSQRLDKAQTKLKEMGISRDSDREQRQYLVGIAGSFQAIARAALNADYSAHPAFENDELRLITAVASFSNSFSEDMRKHGHKYYFESNDEIESDESGNDPHEAGGFVVPRASDYPELCKTIITDWYFAEPEEGIMEWIEGVNRRSRGFDLGTLGPGVISSVFREQSEKWEIITAQYVSKVILLVHQFIAISLSSVCTDTQVVKNITAAIMKDLCDRYKSAMSQAMLLVNVERQFKPYTLNHYFNHNQQRSYGNRMSQRLQDKSYETNNYNGQEKRIVVALANIADAVTSKSNEEYTMETIHDILDAYYKVAYKRFVDNVFKQAVDFKLLSGPDSPLGLFCEQWVLGLDAAQLLAVAGESRRNRIIRERLKKEIEDLEIAMEILL
jgi:dynamin family protein